MEASSKGELVNGLQQRLCHPGNAHRLEKLAPRRAGIRPPLVRAHRDLVHEPASAR
jgi:hypothetical protein